MRCAVWLLGWATMTTLARAEEPPRVQLRYAAPAACPDHAVLRDLVTARLGYSAFAEDAARVVEVRIEGGPSEYVGTVDGAATSVLRATSCEDVLEALATVVALQIDPLGLGAAEPPREALDAELEALDEEAPPAAAVVPPARRPLRLRVELGPVMRVSAAPSVALGGAAGLGVRVGAFDLSAGFSVEHSLRGRRVDGSAVHGLLIRGHVVPCGALSALRLCGVVELGQLRLRADDLGVRDGGSALIAHAGMRFGVDWERDGLGVRVALQGALALVRPRLLVGEARIWRAPPVAASLVATFWFDVHRRGPRG